jgi:transmembrane 9 superfamily member 2/4
MPLDYYRLPFCKPKDGVQRDHENLGEFLAGDRIENSPYVLKMKTDMYCEQLCISHLGRTEVQGINPTKIVKAIHRNYHNNWIVDNLPAATKSETQDPNNPNIRYWQGFPIGFELEEKAYINNHVNIEIMYHKVETESDKYRVVRFTVEPFSIQHKFEPLTDDANFDDKSILGRSHKILNPIDSCKEDVQVHTNISMLNEFQEASGQVLFTYDVIWQENKDLKWASRWDVYLDMSGTMPAKVHWISIANSLVIVFVLSAMIIAILVRNLHRDINRYNKVAMDEESRAEELEEYGWKLVCTKVSLKLFCFHPDSVVSFDHHFQGTC